MSDLSNKLKEFTDWLVNINLPPPVTEIRIIELDRNPEIDKKGRVKIEKINIHKPENYEERFNELMTSGISWLNMSCYGVYDEYLIIVIEKPMKNFGLNPKPSVNFSAPNTEVIRRKWDATQAIIVE